MANKETVCILGATGFIGSHLYKHLNTPSVAFNTIGTTRRSKHDPELKYVDVLEKNSLEHFLCMTDPEYLVISAGTKDIVFCEKNPEFAHMLNTRPVLWILDSIQKNNLKTNIIFISSDYVFDGNSCFYHEQSHPNPKTIYGKTKFEAEQLLLSQSHCSFKIVRTAAVQGKGARFYDYVLSALIKDTKIDVFNNTYFSPTPITLFSKVIETLLSNYATISDKIIHIVGDIRCTRYELALMYFRMAKRNPSKIIPVSVDLLSTGFQKDLSLHPSAFTKEQQKDTVYNYLSQLVEEDLL